jgi:hypothetical protein
MLYDKIKVKAFSILCDSEKPDKLLNQFRLVSGCAGPL